MQPERSFDIHLYSNGSPTSSQAQAAELMRTSFAKYTQYIHHLKIRFADVIDRGGQGTKVCRIRVRLVDVLGAPEVVVEGHASRSRDAMTRAVAAAEREMASMIADTERRNRQLQRLKKKRLAQKAAAADGDGTPKIPQDGPFARIRKTTPRAVKTAHPLRKRHIHKTQVQSRATSEREMSPARASRKSTRKSANRSKRDSNLTRRTQRAVHSPEARAANEKARGG